MFLMVNYFYKDKIFLYFLRQERLLANFAELVVCIPWALSVPFGFSGQKVNDASAVTVHGTKFAILTISAQLVTARMHVAEK